MFVVELLVVLPAVLIIGSLALQFAALTDRSLHSHDEPQMNAAYFVEMGLNFDPSRVRGAKRKRPRLPRAVFLKFLEP